MLKVSPLKNGKLDIFYENSEGQILKIITIHETEFTEIPLEDLRDLILDVTEEQLSLLETSNIIGFDEQPEYEEYEFPYEYHASAGKYY